MSKVDTLLKLIAYQKQHPQASDAEIAKGIGISLGHVRRCKKEVNLLKHQLVEPSLQSGQVQFLLSLLNQREPDQQEIAQHLQRQIGVSYTGSLRIKQPEEQASLSWLEIGELTDAELGSLNHPDLLMSYWLLGLCYDPLLMSYRNGEIEGRLAIGCEAVKEHSEWQLTLRKDLRWSDGKPITHEEVIKALSMNFASSLTEIKPDGETQLRVRFSQDEPLFPLRLRYIYPFPSHATQPYHVISGAYQLKRFRPDAMTLHFEQNPNYYRGEDHCIDWLTVKRFTRPANAVKAIEDGTIDLLSICLHAMQSLYQFPTTMPCQQWPFFEDSYYALFLNRHHGPLSDKRNCSLLKAAIDYQAINFYLRMGQIVDGAEVVPPSQPLDIRVACSTNTDSSGGAVHNLAHLVGQSVGSSVKSPISVEGSILEIKEAIREKADAFLIPLIFGGEYSYLSTYFCSDGIYNYFGYTNPQIDAMLSQLDQTADMAARKRIGRRVLSRLQGDFAVILLAPCLQYIVSPLEIQFDNNLTNLGDLRLNMSQVTVERHQSG